MTREQKILSLLAQFKELGIDKKIDYDKLKYPDDWGSLPRLEAEDNSSVDNTK